MTPAASPAEQYEAWRQREGINNLQAVRSAWLAAYAAGERAQWQKMVCHFHKLPSGSQQPLTACLECVHAGQAAQKEVDARIAERKRLV